MAGAGEGGGRGWGSRSLIVSKARRCDPMSVAASRAFGRMASSETTRTPPGGDWTWAEEGPQDKAMRKESQKYFGVNSGSNNTHSFFPFFDAWATLLRDPPRPFPAWRASGRRGSECRRRTVAGLAPPARGRQTRARYNSGLFRPCPIFFTETSASCPALAAPSHARAPTWRARTRGHW